jgi:prepilin-type N-terminal cleavage/methylation domain-containing protein
VTQRVDALRHQAGFTIIEVLIAMFVLLLGVLATTTLLNTANAETERNQARNGATNLVRDIIEASRALPYEQANPTTDATGADDSTLETALQNMAPSSGGSASGSSFADTDGSAGGWQIVRRGVTYKVSLEACVVDDAKDGAVANHGSPASDGSGYYCPNPPTSATVDPNGDDYRRVKVTAAWTSNSCNGCGTSGQTASVKTYSVAQTAVIVNPSGGLGPPPKGPPSFGNPINCRSITVSQQYGPEAVAVLFKVADPVNTESNQTVPTATDGTNGNKTYSFTYAPTEADVPDGTYDMTIQGINRSGFIGQATTVTLYINCKEPDPATNVKGGFDWRRCANYPVSCAAGDRVFDLDWQASPDGDVVGYNIWRVNGTEDFNSATKDDTLVECASRSQDPPTTRPGDVDFLEPFQPSCYDTAIEDADASLFPFPVLPPDRISLDGRTGSYWIQAVDMEPTNNPSIAPPGVRTTLTNHTDVFTKTENMLNLRPDTPLDIDISNSNGQPCLSWSDSSDLDWQGNAITSPILFYRIYRGTSTVVSTAIVVQGKDGASPSVNVPDVPYKSRIGRALPNVGDNCDTDPANAGRSSFLDKTAPASAVYWVTAVDKDYLESFPTVASTWVAP